MKVSLFCMFSTIYVLLQRSVAGIQLVSSGKTITSSSTPNDWIADRAIDGDARRAPNVCDCCAATDNTYEPWYQLDLGRSYMIHSISVLGRGGDGDGRGYGHTLQNMEIKLGTSSSGGNVLTTNTAPVYTFNYTLSTPTSGRYITLTLRDTTQYFVICELYVYAECDTNTYGDGCTQPCGNCLNNEKCDSVDGKCTSCAAGYQGDTCKQGCNVGYFGQGCSSQCFCTGTTCDSATGICPSGNCQPGYQGQKCDTECDDGYFGSGCSRQCYCEGDPCNKQTGVCPSGNCQPGYQGSTCETLCNQGYFGQGCSSTCFCNGTTCEPVTGICPSGNCQPGYQGEKCDKTMICDDGYYGDNCAIQCFCEGDPCNNVTGICPSGRCQPGYQGSTCNKDCNGGYFGRSCSNQCFCEINTCDPITGICSSGNCQSGYQGEKCDSECMAGSYGLNCSESCGQCKDGVCNNVDGNCLYGCNPGYHGSLCKQVVGQFTECQTCPSLGLVIGGTIFGLVIVEILVAAIWFLLRRIKQSNQKKKSTENHYDMPVRENFEAEHPYGQREDISAPAYMNTELRAWQ